MSERLEKLKEFMERENYFYKVGDTIAFEEYKYLSNEACKSVVKQRLLPPTSAGHGLENPCKVEVDCVSCGRVYLLSPRSKTEALDIVLHQGWFRGGFKCSECCRKEETKKREREEEERLKYEQWREQEWENLWDPNMSFAKGWSPYQKLGLVEKVIRGREAEAEELILEMDYQDFLQTPYWKAVASMVRKKNKYKCVLCGESYGLNVHHKTYENHGAEHLHLDDLTLLCSECHEKFHEVEE